MSESDRFLANMKLQIEQFDPIDMEAGIWAYQSLVKALEEERRIEAQLDWAGADNLLSEQSLRNECILRRLNKGLISQDEADKLYRGAV